jgi:hypothetical protein
MPFDGTEFDSNPSAALRVANRMIDLLSEPRGWTQGKMKIETSNGMAYCLAGAMRQAAADCVSNPLLRMWTKRVVRKHLDAVIMERSSDRIARIAVRCGMQDALIISFNDQQQHYWVMKALYAARGRIRADEKAHCVENQSSDAMISVG